ncbi:MAG: MFS transporter [Anaerolineae bacterium]
MIGDEESQAERQRSADGLRHRWARFYFRLYGMGYVRSPHHLLALPIRWLDYNLERGARPQALPRDRLLGLRYFWLDSLFAAISDNFYVNFVALFALAYGATRGQIGLLTAAANLMGALAFFPGAWAVDRYGRRKPVVLFSGAFVGRLAFLLLAALPLFIPRPEWAIWGILVLHAMRSFMGNFANPAWTALVADLVPSFMRGRYLSSRNIAMGVAALVVAPVAGWMISTLNGRYDLRYLGYQAVFLMAFVFGMLSMYCFWRIPEPPARGTGAHGHSLRALWEVAQARPGFVGLVASAFVWNLAIQVAAPFFNIYLVEGLGGTASTVGTAAGVSSLFSLGGQRLFGRLLDRRGAWWVQRLTGFMIPLLPFAWMVINRPWQVYFITAFGGLSWAGYNLSNFTLLLDLTPDDDRPQAVALYQTVVFMSAVIGPLLGGYLAQSLGYKPVFGISGVGRLVGMLLFLWLAMGRAAKMGERPAA